MYLLKTLLQFSENSAKISQKFRKIGSYSDVGVLDECFPAIKNNYNPEYEGLSVI